MLRISIQIGVLSLSNAEISSTMKGRISELTVATAFMENGYVVLEPMCAETFDMLVHKIGTNDYTKVQIKTLGIRERNGVKYYICKGRRNTGNPYTTEETDIFAGVCGNEVYLINNSGISEYWSRVDEAAMKWKQLPTLLN